VGVVSDLLFGVRVIVDALGVTYPTRNRVRFQGAATVADDPTFKETDVTIGGSGVAATFGATTVSSLTIGTTEWEGSQPSASIAPGATVNLLANAITIPSTPGTYVVRFVVKAWALGESGKVLGAFWGITFDMGQGSSGAAVVLSSATGTGNFAYALQKPFVLGNLSSTPAAGSVNYSLSGNSLQIQGSGFPVATAFSSGATYTAGNMVTNDTPSRLYVVTSGGTDSSSGGPTTTGTGSPPTVTVGGLTYGYVGLAAAQPSFQVSSVVLE
jgi:hypothetical protein